MTHFITHHQTVQNSTEFPSTPPTPVLRRYDGAMAMTMALSHRIVGQGAETSSLRGDGLPGKMHGLRTGPVRWFDHHHTSLPCHPSRRLRRALLGTARWLDGLLGGQQRPRRTATSATTGWTDLLTLYAMCVANVASQVSRLVWRNREWAFPESASVNNYATLSKMTSDRLQYR